MSNAVHPGNSTQGQICFSGGHSLEPAAERPRGEEQYGELRKVLELLISMKKSGEGLKQDSCWGVCRREGL